MAERLGKFRLKFGSKRKEINAVTYAQMLIATNVMAEESANELEVGARLQIRVVAERKGSYESELLIYAAGLIGITSPYVTKENIQIVKQFGSHVISIIGNCWKLKRFLNGEKEKSVQIHGNDAIIVNGNNNTIIVDRSTYNVFRQDRIQESMNDGFTAMADDAEIKSFELLDSKNRPLFAADRNDFPAIAKQLPGEEERKKKRVRKATLSVVRQSFERNRKSDFLWAGRTISAFIEHEAFWDKIDKGERFAKGDKLVTTLEIEETYEKSIKAWKHKGYKILEVLEHRPRAGQPSLFADDGKLPKRRTTRKKSQT